MAPTAKQRAEARRLTAAMAKVGFALPGTLLERYTRCGSPGCKCRGEPAQLHGPYWFWTRKVQAKTISRVLSAEQVDDYREWFDNQRRLRALMHELEQLSLAVVDADPRTPTRQPKPPTANPKPNPQTPRNRGSTPRSRRR